MAYAAVAAAAASAIANKVGSGQPSPPQSFLGAPSYVNVQPVGVNLGAVLQPFMEGSPQNGGSGLNYTSRFLNGMRSMDTGYTTLKGSEDNSPDLFFICTFLGLFALVYTLKKHRSR